MDAALASDPVLADAISQDWLFTLLLPPIYHTYQNYQAAAELYLPMIPYRQPLPYCLQLKAQPQHTSDGFIQIQATGIYTDKRNVAEAVKSAPVPMPQQPESSIPPQGRAYL